MNILFGKFIGGRGTADGGRQTVDEGRQTVDGGRGRLTANDFDKFFLNITN